MVHKINPITTSKLLTHIPESSITRKSNSLNLVKKGTNKNPYKFFFTNRIINIWNDLPEHVVNAKSMNVLKNSIDTHFRDFKYSIEGELDALFQFP